MSKKSPSPLPLRVSAPPRESEKQDAQPGLVPKLRFPEFKNEVGWSLASIGQVCTSFSGGTPSTSQKEYYGGDIPFIRSGEIDCSTTELFLSDDGLKNSAAKLVELGDILVALYGANSGDVALAKIEGAINQAILCLRSESSNPFIYQFLSHRKSWIIDTFLQGGQGNLSGEIVKSIALAFPSLPEQQKIAKCLSTLDEVIAAQVRKVDELKTYKKGLMQQLFPREGETQPRLRFPEFQNAGEWEVTTIGSICRLKAGEFIPASRIKDGFQDGMFPCYGGNGRRGYVHSSTHEGLYVLIGRQGALCGNVNLISGRFYATEHALVVTPQEGYAPDWLFYALNDLNLNRFSIGQAQPGLSVGVLNNVSIVVPRNRDEQQRIASCLSSLDDLICAEVQKLEALKTHKRGLMQQLFPSPEDR